MGAGVGGGSFSLFLHFWLPAAPLRVCRDLDRFVLLGFSPNFAGPIGLPRTPLAVVTDSFVKIPVPGKSAPPAEPLPLVQKPLLVAFLFPLFLKQKVLAVSSMVDLK